MMKLKYSSSILSLLVGIIMTGIFNSAFAAHGFQPSEWQCRATDANGQTWVYFSASREEALKEAWSACCRFSHRPRSCLSGLNTCNFDRASHSQKWRCFASDWREKM